jgi:ABC-type molybdate transport system substrate-binding protein
MISLGKDFQATAASPVRFTFASLGVLQGKMAAGDMPDVFIAPSSAIAKAEESPG